MRHLIFLLRVQCLHPSDGHSAWLKAGEELGTCKAPSQVCCNHEEGQGIHLNC